MFVEHKEAGEVRELDEADRLLLRAADRIEKHGLSNWGAIDAHGRRCVVYTLQMLGTSSDVRWQANERIYKAISPKTVPRWSDSTPADVVVATLRAVALNR